MDLSLSFAPPGASRPGMSRRKPSHTRAATALFGILSPTNLLGGGAQPSPATSPRPPGAWTPTHKPRVRSVSNYRASAPTSPIMGAAPRGLGLGLGFGFGQSTPDLGHGRPGFASPSGWGYEEEHGEDEDESAPLPTFEVPPSLLAVDVALAPGETRSCKSYFIY